MYAWDDNFLSVAPRFSAPGGGVPSGLGSLFAGGYLTQKGASVMDCPSRTIDKMGGTFFRSAWSDIRYAKECVKQRKQTLEFDPNEPFWTSGGKATWSNGDLIGECGTMGPGNWPAVNSIVWCDGWWLFEASRSLSMIWGAQITGPRGDASRGCTGGVGSQHRTPSGYCLIMGSYAMRIDDIADYTWHSFKLDEIQGQSIASDAVHAFYHRPDMWIYDPGVGWAYPNFDDPGNLTKADWFSNHDMGYNVLFTDGSVKTYSDAGFSLYKEMLLEDVKWNRLTPAMSKGTIVNRYFDSLYAQD